MSNAEFAHEELPPDYRSNLAETMLTQLAEEQTRAEYYSQRGVYLSPTESERVLGLAMKQASRTETDGEPVVDDPTLLDFYATRLTNFVTAVKLWKQSHPGVPLPRDYLALSKYLDEEQSK